MKTRNLLLLSLGLVCGALSAPAQGTFQNPGFESATLVPVQGGQFFDFAQAFPGWTGYVGGVQRGLTWYNGLPLSTAGFSIIDHSFSNPAGAPGGVIEGNFTAVVIAGVSGVQQTFDTTLEQMSLVPVAAESLRFRALFDSNAGTGSFFSVALGGQALSLVPVGSGANYTLYAADVHHWAGQTVELAFTSHTNLQWHIPAFLYLDSIQFSDVAVPEPSVFGLTALGALFLGWRALRRRQ